MGHRGEAVSYRFGSVLAMTGLLLSFVLSVYLRDPGPFMAVGGAGVLGKWLEGTAERWKEGNHNQGADQ